MSEIETRLAALGLTVPELLLPGPQVDLEKWAVIACDQFTQDAAYWETVKTLAGNAPSTLKLILPEVYLNSKDEAALAQRKNAIHRAMESFLAGGVFAAPRRAGVYLERDTPFQKARRGLVLAIDLEAYDWRPAEKPLIRATEGTVSARLPPRMNIRQGAPLESSHVLLLIDDEDDAIIPAIGREAKNAAPLYSTPLMMNSGAVSGWTFETEKALVLLADGLERLAKKANARYGVTEKTPFLYAVGDGNHSLAAAKAVWDEYKARGPVSEFHPARYALVELENLYDPALTFEPIHRVVFGAEPRAVFEALSVLPGFTVETLPENGGPANVFRIRGDSTDIAAVAVEPLLEQFAAEHHGVTVDYIHGEKELLRIAAQAPKTAAGILLPPISKNGFFRTIAQNGPLPRKSFSMGEGSEKRFYLECRKLF